MLQRQTYQEQLSDEDQNQLLTPAFLIDLLKRRWVLFVVPLTLFLTLGAIVALIWPATYLSEGKILVESPQIPADLVRPTVAVLANERVQIIEQRIMTRDNLLAIAKKFNLTLGWRGRISGTELVDFIRQRTQIRPLELQNRRDVQAIAFTVGFIYEQPQIAAKVANELVTMILNEDVRGRTNSATETTRFLAQEAKRLEGQISQIDTQLVNLRRAHAADAAAGAATDGTTQSEDAKQLAALKAELLLRSATLSSEHPDIRALKRRIEAFDKSIADAKDKDGAKPADPAKGSADVSQKPGTDASTKTPAAPVPTAATFDALLTQKINLNTELTGVTQKLAAARLGENLERGQYAERLQVIEQPTLPDKPVSPDRKKIFTVAFVLAFAASGGLVFAAEMLNPAIRRTSDLYSIIDSHLIVAIPYVTTDWELRRRRKKIVIAAGTLALLAVAGFVAVLFVLPPLDVLFAKISARLLG